MDGRDRRRYLDGAFTAGGRAPQHLPPFRSTISPRAANNYASRLRAAVSSRTASPIHHGGETAKTRGRNHALSAAGKTIVFRPQGRLRRFRHASNAEIGNSPAQKQDSLPAADSGAGQLASCVQAFGSRRAKPFPVGQHISIPRRIRAGLSIAAHGTMAPGWVRTCRARWLHVFVSARPRQGPHSRRHRCHSQPTMPSIPVCNFRHAGVTRTAARASGTSAAARHHRHVCSSGAHQPGGNPLSATVSGSPADHHAGVRADRPHLSE